MFLECMIFLYLLQTDAASSKSLFGQSLCPSHLSTMSTQHPPPQSNWWDPHEGPANNGKFIKKLPISVTVTAGLHFTKTCCKNSTRSNLFCAKISLVGQSASSALLRQFLWQSHLWESLIQTPSPQLNQLLGHTEKVIMIYSRAKYHQHC